MKKLQIRTLLWVLWTLILFVVLFLPIRESLIPKWGGFPYWDKVIHFGLFAVTGFVSVFGASFLSSFVARLLFGLVFGLALAAVTELGQYLIPSRDPDLYDFFADLAGLFFGLLVYTVFFFYNKLHSRPGL